MAQKPLRTVVEPLQAALWLLILDPSANLSLCWVLRGFPKEGLERVKYFWSPQTHTHKEIFHASLFMDRGKSKVDSNHH